MLKVKWRRKCFLNWGGGERGSIQVETNYLKASPCKHRVRSLLTLTFDDGHEHIPPFSKNNVTLGNSLAVQWLGLGAFTAVA